MRTDAGRIAIETDSAGTLDALAKAWAIDSLRSAV